MIATVIVNLPEEIRNQLELEINSVFEKYSQFRVGANGPTKYKNFPHIKITRIDDASLHMNKIISVVKTAAKIRPFQIEVTGVGIIESGGSHHVVLEIKENEILRKLHKKIFEGLYQLINDDWRKLGGKNYHPHLSIITWLPKDKAIKVKESIKIKPFNFVAKEIAIKTMGDGNKAKLSNVFALK